MLLILGGTFPLTDVPGATVQQKANFLSSIAKLFIYFLHLSSIQLHGLVPMSN